MPVNYGETNYLVASGLYAGWQASIPSWGKERLRVVGQVVIGSENSNIGSTAGNYNSILGGAANTIGSGVQTSTIINGFINYINGGSYNLVGNAEASIINGGIKNCILGGKYNAISTNAGYNTILNGNGVTISSGVIYSTVVNGFNNILGPGINRSTICNGDSNTINHNDCFIGGGFNNLITASSQGNNIILGGGLNTIGSGVSFSCIGNGFMNVIETATCSSIVGGVSNTILSSHGFIGAGNENYINTGSSYATVAGGYQNRANAQFSSIPGGNRASTTRYGELAHAAGYFEFEEGSAQHSIFVLRGKTTSGSQTTTLGLNGTTTSRLTVASGFILSGTINIVGSISTGANVARYVRQFTIKNVGGTTSLVGSIITLGTDEAAGTTISITADNTNDALQINVTRAASETWR